MGFMDKAREQAAQQKAQTAAIAATREPAAVHYKVESMRESLIGGKFSAASLQSLLNQRASEGWMLRQIIEADVKGRLGPGGTGGLVIIFERSAL